MEEIEIIKPDDWHIHFRDNEIMKEVVPETTKYFARGMIMPNLIPPILNGKDAINYREKIKKVIPQKDNFKPFMTIYLTEKTTKYDLRESYCDNSVLLQNFTQQVQQQILNLVLRI